MSEIIKDQLTTFKEFLQTAKPHFVAYLKEISQNKKNKYWEKEDWENAKGLCFIYDADTLDINCCGWDEDMEDLSEETETSFFVQSFNKATGRPAEAHFRPDSIDSLQLDGLADTYEAWFVECWKEAKGKRFKKKVYAHWDDGNYYRDMDSGEFHDHTIVLRHLAPDDVDDIQEEVTEEFTILEKRNGLQAYRNPKGKMITGYLYDRAYEFDNGLAGARIKDTGKYGFINTSGEVVIPYIYDNITILGIFSEGLLAARLGEKWGYINQQNQTLIPFMYERAEEFANSIARVQLNGKWGFINHENETVVPFLYDEADDFEEGLACVKMGRKCGFINMQNETVIPFMYQTGDSFYDGLAGMTKDGKVGFINHENETVIPFLYQQHRYFKGDLCSVQLNDKWGYINRENETVIPFIYDYAEKFDAQGLAEVRQNDKTGYINTKNEVVIPCIIDNMIYFKGDKAEVSISRQRRSIDRLGNFTPTGIKDDLIIVNRSYSENAYFNPQTKFITPFIYTHAGYFSEGLAIASKIQEGKEKYGVIDTNFYAVVPFIYDEMSYTRGFSEGVVLARLEDKWGFINRKNEIVIPFMYDYGSEFSNSVASVSLKGKSGYVNIKNEVIIPFEYDYAGDFENGLAMVERNKKYGYINVSARASTSLPILC